MDQAAAHAIDLTAILVAVIAGVFGVAKIIATWWVQKNIKDAQLRQVLENALTNALGTIQQAASGQIMSSRLTMPLSDLIPEHVRPGVQYVLDHASEAVARFGITPDLVADKLIARIGAKEIETNIAVTANPGNPAVVPPLAPSPEGAQASQLNRDELVRIASGGTP